MKLQCIKNNLILIFLFFVGFNLYSQNQYMSYQAVIRDASNLLKINSSVGIKISIIYDDGFGGPITTYYSENHAVVTNENGLATLKIGNGSSPVGDFNAIPWRNGITLKLKTEIDPDGGSNYTIVGSSELLAVPHSYTADYAELADEVSPRVILQSIVDSRLQINERNLFIDTNAAITPFRTGMYQVTFYGQGINDAQYPNQTGLRDDMMKMFLFDVTSDQAISSHDVIKLFIDSGEANPLTGFSYFFKYYSLTPSVTTFMQLTAGHTYQLKYIMTADNPPIGLNYWGYGPTAITALKVD